MIRFNGAERENALPNRQVMLFDGWDYIPVTFSPASSPDLPKKDEALLTAVTPEVRS